MDFVFDPSLVLYLPLYELDGASFMSKDAYGHLCTVTGALWRPYGYEFDGTDDLISLGTPEQFKWDTGDFTLIIWGKDDKATDATFASKGYNTGVNGDWILRSHKTNGLEFYVINPTTMTTFRWTGFTSISSEWNHIAISRVGGALVMMVNGAIKATATHTDNLGNNASNLILGENASGGGSEYLQGFIGECLIHNKRGLSPLEIRHNYLATKWRYR